MSAGNLTPHYAFFPKIGSDRVFLHILLDTFTDYRRARSYKRWKALICGFILLVNSKVAEVVIIE
jgi:hypothetical protein